MKKYVIGIDYGTLSGRCILVDALTGAEIAESVLEYPHSVMDEALPTGEKLPPLWALQDPQDYLEVLKYTVRDVLQKTGVFPEEIAGMGIDFTTCTLLPMDSKGTPLCFRSEYAKNPHAYVKLWKHHAAQKYADEINRLAKERGEEWLDSYGGKISAEWVFPKILQILREAPEIYEATDRFTEAGDWLSLMLTGVETHCAAFAGYKAMWNAESGYPSDAFFSALDPGMHGIIGSKVSENVLGVGCSAGVLNQAGAELTGLLPGTPLSLPLPDGHVGMPALRVTTPGKMMMIVGTSSCYFIHAQKGHRVPGVCGCVRDGVIPGLDTYEAGQSGCGDIFDWFIRNGLPAKYEEEAKRAGVGIHQLLRKKAAQLAPGESGLLALDWLNGNRSTLMDANLTGAILGLTLQTKPEEIYRAWLEATAFGAKVILDTFEENGVPFHEIIAAGGIAQKDDLMMQIYADVFGREIKIAGTRQAGALGSAIYAAVAGGVYSDLQAAADVMANPESKTYLPNAAAHQVYTLLYTEYKRLYDLFGRDENSVMKQVKRIAEAHRAN